MPPITERPLPSFINGVSDMIRVMKRRRFMRTLVAAPAAAPALLAQQAAPAAPAAPVQQPLDGPGRAAPAAGGRGAGPAAQDIKLDVVSPDNVAEPETRFFT